MKTSRPLILFIIAIASVPASATSTMCTFSGGSGPSYREVEFLGYEQVQSVQFNLPEGPRSVPSAYYQVLVLDQDAKTVSFVFENPGDPGFPPSFSLKGSGGKVLMRSAEGAFSGELACGTQRTR